MPGAAAGTVSTSGPDAGTGLASPSLSSARNALVNPLANLSKGNSTPTQQSGPPAWAVPYLQGAMGSAKQAFNSGAGAVQPFNSTQLEGMNTLAEYAKSGANGMIPGMQNTYDFLTNPGLLNPNSNPYLASSVSAAVAPMTQNFKDTVMPSINSGAESAGVFGGSRQGVAQGLAANTLEQDIGNTSSTMYSNAYNSGLQTMLGALGEGPAITNAGELPGQILEGIGNTEQQQAQSVANQPYTQLNDYSSILDALLGQSGTSTTASGPSTLQNATSVAAIIAALGGMFGGSGRGGGGGA